MEYPPTGAMNYENRKNLYLTRYGDPLCRQISGSPTDIKHFIVVPAYKENDLLTLLKSLVSCEAPKSLTEVIILFNHRENDSQEIKQATMEHYEKTMEWAEQTKGNLIFNIPKPVELDEKNAGVGWARKIGMDLAIARSTADSIITCLDADCEVSSNYLREIEKYFLENTKAPGATIYFEHPLASENSYEIQQYELHLRYFNQAQRFAGFPWAFHTVGSAMSVRSSAYMKQGGMNRRKAGEDFYFIHKIIALGGFSDITKATVYPSSRKSDRVPFGTGHAMNQSMESYMTYPFEIFEDLQHWLKGLEQLYLTEGKVMGEGKWCEYLRSIDAEESIKKMVDKSPSFQVFKKHFFHWLSAFKIMKYCNGYNRKNVKEESLKLLNKSDISVDPALTLEELLLKYRSWERDQNWEPILGA